MAWDNWFEVVEEFSRLRLTRESDRLTALIGVATVFQSSLKCAYLAGLWEKDIARGLLWDLTRYENATSPVRRHRRSTMPSWSWASMVFKTEGSGIIFPAGHDESFQTDDRFAYVNTDMPVGAMDSNFGTQKSIWIRGAVVMAIACAQCESTEEEDALILLFEQDIEEAVLVTKMKMKLDATGITEGFLPNEESTIVRCILIGSMIEADWDSDNQVTFLCSCVLKASVTILDGFERVGVWDVREDAGIFRDASEMVLKLT
jgi:hypothetical protein